MHNKNKALNRIQLMIDREIMAINLQNDTLELMKHVFDNADYYNIEEQRYYEIYQEIKEHKKDIENRMIYLDGLEASREMLLEVYYEQIK